MSKAWIEALTEHIKQKDNEAASAYGRDQHRLGVVSAKAPAFFADLAVALEEDFAEVQALLQGDITSSETDIVANGHDRLTMTRSRFPWFDAVLRCESASLVLDYARGKGVAGNSKIATGSERKVTVFPFVVGPDDVLTVEEGFGENPKSFKEPEDLARYLVEMLFAA
jgi:hypothetical protein